MCYRSVSAIARFLAQIEHVPADHSNGRDLKVASPPLWAPGSHDSGEPDLACFAENRSVRTLGKQRSRDVSWDILGQTNHVKLTCRPPP